MTKLTEGQFYRAIVEASKHVDRFRMFGPEFVEKVKSLQLPVPPQGYVANKREFPIYAAIVAARDPSVFAAEVVAAMRLAWEYYEKN